MTLTEDIMQELTHTEVPWTLQSAQEFLNHIWPTAINIGYWPSITGSTVYKGWSLKDLDLVLTPTESFVSANETFLVAWIEALTDYSPEFPSNGDTPSRRYLTRSYQGKRIDFILVRTL